MSFAVVQPGALSCNRSFANGPGGPNDDSPAPKDIHAYAGPVASASAALLCRIPCVGGNGAVERIAFPGLSSPASREDLLESARLLLTNDKAWQEEVDASQDRAAEFLSFRETALRLQSTRS
jgi:hypothetical protein